MATVRGALPDGWVPALGVRFRGGQATVPDDRLDEVLEFGRAHRPQWGLEVIGTRAYSDMRVAELRSILDEREVEYAAKATKADLLELIEASEPDAADED